MDEENLSQKLSHLSTQITTVVANDHQSLLKDIQIDIQTIPDYLTKRNKSFQQMLSEILSTTTELKSNHKDKREDLRKIAILIYKSMSIQTYQHLWTHYLKAGVGQLISQACSYSTNRPIWPKEIKIMVQSITKTNEENEYEICFTFVQHYIEVLENQLKKYQYELNAKVNHFQNYSLTIQKQIETYIEQHLVNVRMEIEHQVELIHYDYHIHAIKLEYLKLKPNPFQEQMMKDVCVSQYEQETSEQELHFLQQQIRHYTTSPKESFQQSTLASCSALNAIQDTRIRQQLFQQLEQTAEQARAEIFNLSLKSAEQERNEYKQKYDVNTKKMFSARAASIETEKLSQIMINLIVLRCKKIAERIQFIYKFKTQMMMASFKE